MTGEINERQSLDDDQARELTGKAGDGDATAAGPTHAGGTLSWGPGGLRTESTDAWMPGPSLASTWGPYFSAMFNPGRVTPWTNFKRMSTGANIARRWWDEREGLREAYEAEHGTNPDQWPARHPGVVLECVQWVARPACLGCQWLHPGVSMRESRWRDEASELAQRHEESG